MGFDVGLLSCVQLCVMLIGRCSIVDFWGQVVCDIYSRPDERITDYRTPWSGIRKADLTHALPFELAKSRIDNILKVMTVFSVMMKLLEQDRHLQVHFILRS